MLPCTTHRHICGCQTKCSSWLRTQLLMCMLRHADWCHELLSRLLAQAAACAMASADVAETQRWGAPACSFCQCLRQQAQHMASVLQMPPATIFREHSQAPLSSSMQLRQAPVQGPSTPACTCQCHRVLSSPTAQSHHRDQILLPLSAHHKVAPKIVMAGGCEAHTVCHLHACSGTRSALLSTS